MSGHGRPWPPPLARLASKMRFVITEDDKVCWQFTGTLVKGYGQFFSDVGTTAHRFAWAALNGPIPDGLLVHHTCENKWCCNPNHLELKTTKEHGKAHGPRGYSRVNADKSHCPRGHEYSHLNSQGRRCCRICDRDNLRASRARRKATAIAQ